mgnify:CR=1 FL=1
MDNEIRSVEVEQILHIRHQVLWPAKSPDFVKVPEDDLGNHFGLYIENKLVSVISLFADGNRIRFRKFATLQEYQNRGLGSRLLDFTIDWAREQGYREIWCDARTSAMAFYEKFGFAKFSEPFFKEEIAYFKIQKSLL